MLKPYPIVPLLFVTTCFAQALNSSPSVQGTSQARQQGTANIPSIGRSFENQYLNLTVLPGWMEVKAVGQKFSLVHGKYILTIDPIFGHASGIMGGRFSEIVEGMPSIGAVMVNVDQPAGGWECAQWPPEGAAITQEISLTNLYTDGSKKDAGCSFPSSGRPVWFGSFFSGNTSDPEYREFTITLAYDTNDVNKLPNKGSSELKSIFAEVTAMLKTLGLKPPITISRIVPESAPPGATVTIYGGGFNLSGIVVRFGEFADQPVQDLIVSPDGNSLKFQIPTSVNAVSCHTDPRVGKETCAPIMVNGVNVNNCPDVDDWGGTFCGLAITPATYRLSVTSDYVSSSSVSLTVTAPESNAVSIALVYPNYLVSVRDVVTVVGNGFTATGNTVQIGSAVVNNVPSPDGKTMKFHAPIPAGTSLFQGLDIFKMFVSNANGQSNSITFDYR